MSTWLPVFPIILPLLLGLALSWINNKDWAWRLGAIGCFAQMIGHSFILAQTANGQVLSVQVAAWSSPFGISLAIDAFSAMMLWISSLVAFFSVLYSRHALDEREFNRFYFPLVQFLMVGVYGSFVTADLFNLYVFFEILLISSFGLLVFGHQSVRFKGLVTYVIMNLFSSLFFLIGVGVLYGLLGGLNLAHLHSLVQTTEHVSMVQAGVGLLLIAYLIKSASFPFFHWLPASYPYASPAIAPLFAGLLTKVGIYAMVRVSSLLVSKDFSVYQTAFVWIAGMTMLTGVMAAASQIQTKRILSYHIISQVGYMVMGFAVFTAHAFGAVLFYLLHHILAKANLFFIQGLLEKYFDSDELKDQGGLIRTHPWMAFVFLSPALALAGLPPFSGFFAKYWIIQSAFVEGWYWLGVVALLTGLATLYSMTKIWNESFQKDPPSRNMNSKPIGWTMWTTVVSLSVVSLGLGVGFPFLYPYFEMAGQQIFEGKAYVQAVLESNR